MEHKFWHNKWAANQLGFHQENVNSRLKNFWPRLGLPENSRVFVPLCGKSLDLIWLSKQHRVLGVELSDIAVRGFFDENKLSANITEDENFRRYSGNSSGNSLDIFCGDFFALSQDDLGSVAGVFDRASLIALPPDLRRRYADHLGQVLSAACKILLITMTYDVKKMNGPPFSIPEAEVFDLFEKNFAVEMLGESEGPDIVGSLRDRGLDTLKEQVFLLTKT